MHPESPFPSQDVTTTIYLFFVSLNALYFFAFFRMGSQNHSINMYHGPKIFPCINFLIIADLPLCLFATAEHWAHLFRQLFVRTPGTLPWVAITNLMFITLCAKSESSNLVKPENEIYMILLCVCACIWCQTSIIIWECIDQFDQNPTAHLGSRRLRHTFKCLCS